MTRPLAIRILALAAAIGLAGQALLVDHLFGLNLLILSASLLLAAVAVRPRTAASRPGSTPGCRSPRSCVVGGVAIRADPLLNLLDAGVGCLLLGGVDRGDRRAGRHPAFGRGRGRARHGDPRLGRNRAPARQRRRAPPGTRRGRAGAAAPRWAAPIARGLLIAVPVASRLHRAVRLGGRRLRDADGAPVRLARRCRPAADPARGRVPHRLGRRRPAGRRGRRPRAAGATPIRGAAGRSRSARGRRGSAAGAV